LMRLDAGKYGVCIDCAASIPEARLKVSPEVQRCMPRKYEHSHP
jgi:RNA polymerase-binding transcription factor DksA